jgi:hypothetical protein
MPTSDFGRAPYIFEGIYNFRNLGDLVLDNHTRTKSGVLFRSDAFGDVTVKDIYHLEQTLGITRLIDLRSDSEIAAEKPTPFIGRGIDYRHRPIEIDPAIARKFAPAGEKLAYRYLEYIEHSGKSIIAAVKDLAESKSKVTVVHCRAGKDRTGVVIAVVLSLLEVSSRNISRDYAITSFAMPRILELLRESPFYAANANRLPDEMHTAEESTMIRFLELICNRHGSVELWALKNGLTRDEILNLKKNLIVDDL